MTAVDIYEEKSIELINLYVNGEIDVRELLTRHHNIYYEIKEMEKQQIMNTYIIADSESTQEDSEHNALKFYERTYGSKGSETEGYICPQTKKQCRDECCVSAEDCHIQAGIGIIFDCKQEPTSSQTEKMYSEEEFKKAVIDAYHTNPQEAKWKNIGINYYNETYGSKGSGNTPKCTCNVDPFLCQIHGTSDGKTITAF